MDSVGKWGAGAAYGPVLTRTDLFLLHMGKSVKLELNPTLAGSNPDFQLTLWMLNGHTGGFNPNGEDHPFTDKDQPATLPRVQELYVITEYSPWCTIIKNDNGVTMNDVCQSMWKEYSENMVTDAEMHSLHPRTQEQVKRAAMSNSQSRQQFGLHYPGQHIRRVDWLRERVMFDKMVSNDEYAQKRLGFKAPNIFIMHLTP